ncbi:MAG: exodeoxyribonuclease VII large subunit [Candidatus Saccharimonadales bacterium]
MEKATNPTFSVSDFIALTNQTLEYSYPTVEVEGEVSSFKINQGKYVFFDIKDAGASVGCFMTVWQLRVPIEDGMKVVVTATPKLTQWGKFSLTVRMVRPSGEGGLKKSFEILKEKLDKEGLFAEDRKRSLPTIPTHVAVISSIQAAGYADFMKIIDDRWGGIVIDVAHVQVQGTSAPDQIIKALAYINAQETPPEVIVIIRGGGSADDLSAFNDELLVRAVAASRVPTLVGVGHEIDTSLVDMVADVRAATPSNAAQLLAPDRHEYIRHVQRRVVGLLPRVEQSILGQQDAVRKVIGSTIDKIDLRISDRLTLIAGVRRVLDELDPNRVLTRGYALIRGTIKIGSIIEIEKTDAIIKAEVKHVDTK